MLIPLSEVIEAYGAVPRGVLHVGGHKGQEADAYSAAGIDKVVWFEANPAMIGPLKKHVEPYGHTVIEACLGETSGKEVTFHIANSNDRSNDGQSSSLLELGTHLISHPEVRYTHDITVTMTTLDELVGEELSDGGLLLNGDIQGAELSMLKGATSVLRFVDVLYLETNIHELYKGCVLLPELDEWLVSQGFECKRISLAGCQHVDCSDGGNRFVGWGDGYWIRSDAPRLFRDSHPEFLDWYE